MFLCSILRKNQMLLISIPKPCHENWNQMSPQDKGRFCQVCSKTVVDFTSLSVEQVQNYFVQRTGQKTCGRFRSDQLTNADNLLPRLLQSSIPFWKKFFAILLILFGNFLSGCHNNFNTGKIQVVPTVGEPEADYAVSETNSARIEPDTAVAIFMKGEIIGDAIPPEPLIQRIDITCENDSLTEPVFTGSIDTVVIEDSVAEAVDDPGIMKIEIIPDSTKQMFDQHGRPIPNPDAKETRKPWR